MKSLKLAITSVTLTLCGALSVNAAEPAVKPHIAQMEKEQIRDGQCRDMGDACVEMVWKQRYGTADGSDSQEDGQPTADHSGWVKPHIEAMDKQKLREGVCQDLGEQCVDAHYEAMLRSRHAGK